MQAVQQRIYAIGDIHGRADLLEALLAAIDAEGQAGDPVIVFLGDIIDRGPDSRRAMDLVREALNRFPGSHLILGNHDHYLLAMMDDSFSTQDSSKWLSSFGGMETVKSYFSDVPRTLDDMADQFQADYGHHRELLDRAVDKVIIGNFCFVHAGIRPGVPLDEQDPHDLRWIREEFLQHVELFEKMIVHGHTPTESDLPEIHRNRIAVDTGAYYSGRLTAAVIETEGALRFICATERSAGSIDVEHIAAEQAANSLDRHLLGTR